MYGKATPYQVFQGIEKLVNHVDKYLKQEGK